MPQTPSRTPTREEFDAASKRVIDTAPAGLSKDEFYALVDKEIERNVATPSAQAKPQAEVPSRWGFIRNAASDAIRTGNSVIEMGNKALEDPIGVARQIPAGVMSRIHHYASDIDTGAAGEQFKQGRYGAAIGNLLPVGEMYKRPVQTATDIYAGAQLAKLGTAMAKTGMRRIPTGAGDTVADTESPVSPTPPVVTKRIPPTEPVDPVSAARAGSTPSPAAPGGAQRSGSVHAAPSPSESLPISTVQPPHEFEANGMNMGSASLPIKEGETISGPDPQEAMYQEILSKLGGQQEAAPVDPAGPRFSDSMMSTDPPEPHMFGDMDRALASREELDQASNLHRAGAEMNSRYDHLTDPDSSGVASSPEAMLIRMLYQVAKDHIKEAAGRDWSPGFVGQTGRYGAAAAKKLPAFGAIANLTRPEAQQ